MQVITELTRGDALLDLIFTNKEKLLGDKKVRGYLSCTTHEIVEFRILQGGNKVNSRSATLDFEKADLSLCLRLHWSL